MSATNLFYEQRRNFSKWIIIFTVVLITFFCSWASKFDLAALFDEEGLKNFGSIIEGFAHPDLSPEFLKRIGLLSIESLLIGVLGITLASILAIFLALFSSQSPGFDSPRLGKKNYITIILSVCFRKSLRFLMAMARAIPEVIWAYFFVRLMGLGSGPAVLAIAISMGAIMGKIFSELIETIDFKQIEILKSMGTGRFGIIWYGILPQIKVPWFDYILFRLECAIRSASILGVVGAGGLGMEISLSIRYFQFDKLATSLLAVLIFVIIIEVLSSYLRKKPIYWGLGLFVIGSLAAFVQLDIPWKDLFVDSTRHIMVLTNWSSEWISTEFFYKAFRLTLLTVAMAFSATSLAFLFAFGFSAFATGSLMMSYFKGGFTKKDPIYFFFWIALLFSRFVLQICRAIPELTWALLFVVWVGPGPFAGLLAIMIHSIGTLGRQYSDSYSGLSTSLVKVVEMQGAGFFGRWSYAVLPQVFSKILVFTLFGFEINIRNMSMMGFVGAGGIGNALHSAISFFFLGELLGYIFIIFIVVIVFDAIGDHLRYLLMRKPVPSYLRKFERIQTCLHVVYDLAGSEKISHQALVVNLSMGGMFIQTDKHSFVKGSRLKFKLYSKDGSQILLQGTADVLHVLKTGLGKGMGVQFMEIDHKFEETLTKIIYQEVNAKK
jgi:phosphonate transport system permease protein